MGRMISEKEVSTVFELKQVLSVLPDSMPVTDAVGELLLLRIYEVDNIQTLEVA